MAKPATGIEDAEMAKYQAEQKKTKEEAEAKYKEDREKEREAAVEHGSILDEDMAKALDEQDAKEKEREEEQAEAVKAGADMSTYHQAGNVKAAEKPERAEKRESR